MGIPVTSVHSCAAGLAALAAACLTIAPSALAAPAPGPLPPPENQALARDILREIIEVRSVHEVGTAGVASLIAARLKAAGFADADVQVLADPKFPHQVNVVTRLRGKGKGKPILWIGHQDVVEAKAEDWTVPPFQLTEKDGYFYGRGTADMKGPNATMLASLIRLKREGFVPDRDIIVAFTADEEVGLAEDGVWWLMRERRDLVDAAMVINTDDASGRLVNGRRTHLEVETSQKIYVTFQLEVTNKGGHSSLPRPDNAIYSLAAGLTRLAAFQFPYKTNATTRLYFERMARMKTGQEKADMLAVSGPTIDEAAARRLAADTASNSLLHSTCVATMLSAGHQENALPQRARATVQCRIMPDETPEATRQTLIGVLADPSISVTIPDQVVSGPESPPSPAVIGKVEKVVRSMWPEVTVIPAMVAGASDSLFTRNAGIPSYGVSGVFEDALDRREHGRDERVGVSAFYEAVEFTYRLMKETSGAGPDALD
jgi:acetylornithine deacetylase/succinyl-diaminopimelate desuccinylase-like protein